MLDVQGKRQKFYVLYGFYIYTASIHYGVGDGCRDSSCSNFTATGLHTTDVPLAKNNFQKLRYLLLSALLAML